MTRRPGPNESWFSGGPIERFRGGWAKIPFRGQLVHYWSDVTDIAETILTPRIHRGERVRWFRTECGMFGNTRGGVPALAGGNWPRCKNCERLLLKAQRKIITTTRRN